MFKYNFSTLDRLSKTTLYVLFLFLQSGYTNAQTVECGTSFIDPLKEVLAENSFCFSSEGYQGIYNYCKLVYINVNVHLFVEDDCCGKTRIVDKNQLESYAFVEDFIKECNGRLANNQDQWHSNLPAACVPIRYVLKGVYMHCNGDIDFYDYANGPYFRNSNSEINIFIQSCGTNSGVASPGVSPYTSIALISAGNLNHEFGHLFGLNHAHEYNDLAGIICPDDTDPHRINWDANGNGVFQDYILNINGQNKMVREKNYFCWTYIGNWPITEGQEADKNYNSVHDCDEATTPGAPTEASPCCNWDNINNNVMAYNNYQNAFTECQSLTMLHRIQHSSVLCNYVSATDPVCPPASAFITQSPNDKNGAYCSETLILSASFNETSNRLIIINMDNNSIAHDSGVNVGETKNVTVSIVPSCSNCIVLNPGTHYKARLTVFNDCQEPAVFEYEFNTKNGNCDRIESVPCPAEEIEPEDPNGGGLTLGLVLSPNPSFGNVNIQFDAEIGEVFQIEVLNLSTNRVIKSMRQFYANEGVNQLRIELQDQQPGYYQITARSSKKVYTGKFLKVN